jgi:ABC-type Fe2+-enterobactin transport system substrate-binding protein
MTPGAGRNVNGTTTINTQPRKLNNQSINGVTLTVDAPVYSLIDPL